MLLKITHANFIKQFSSHHVKRTSLSNQREGGACCRSTLEFESLLLSYMTSICWLLLKAEFYCVFGTSGATVQCPRLEIHLKVLSKQYETEHISSVVQRIAVDL